jgi:uncharacterized protein with PhoU and TrkA domain
MSSDDPYGKLVLFRLDALAEDVQRVEDKVEALLIDVAMLKVKAGVWGAVAGAIPSTIAVAMMLVAG